MGNPTVHIQQLNHINWLDGAICSFALAGSNHIWQVNISSHITYLNTLSGLLNADEHERANRYYRDPDRQRFIISRAVLRILLGRYLNLAPQSIAFRVGDNKKPVIESSESLHYNVSHSGNYILIAISETEVGVDVEQPDPHMHYQEIMNISYSKAEADYVTQSVLPLHAFYTLWTRKEALLKATAKGIDDALKFVPSVDGSYANMYNAIGSDKSWHVRSFEVNDQHIGSIAAAHSGNTFWWFNLQ